MRTVAASNVSKIVVCERMKKYEVKIIPCDNTIVGKRNIQVPDTVMEK